jgi:dihydrodipicolinate synthase/N-acetylneuraminate lyase
MISSSDLHGIVAMMPAFTTDNGGDVNATDTIDTARLEAGVNYMIRDGANVITTTGSFGEASNLLPNEFETLARATVEVVKRRIPVIIGCVGQNTRDVISKAKVAERAGADGVICAVPYYFPSTVENAVNFYDDIARMFPKLGILIYHNPTLHRITIPVSAFEAISKNKNIVGMKDSHRTPSAFMQLMDIVRGKISVFVQQDQYYPYAELGAAGFWSIDIWMGPEPLVRLRDMVDQGNVPAAKQIIKDILQHRGYTQDLCWREMGHKMGIRYAGYVDPGPLRPPFVKVPENVREQLKRRAEHWRSLCKKYARAEAA